MTGGTTCPQPPEASAKLPLGLGGWVFGGKQWGGQNDRDSREVMEAAYASGIRHFDTAAGYGHSERVVGEFLRDKREHVFLASKVFPNGGAVKVRTTLESSLERLRTDRIDLYYLHWPVSGYAIREQMEAMAQAREEGLIGAIGVSNYSVSQLGEALQVAPVDFIQLGYHLLWRVIEKDVVPFCQRQGIRIVTYSALAQGILTGKFPRNPEFPQGDVRNEGVIHFRKDYWPRVYAAVEELKELADKAGRPLSHLAIRWCTAQPGIHTVLMGARKLAQLRENVAAMEGEIDPAILKEMTRISDELRPHLPEAKTLFDKNP